jgi:hypothetical protein
MPDRVFIRRPPPGEADGRKPYRMRSVLLTSGGILVLTVAIAVSLLPVEDATRVTTDTPDYCNQLYSLASAEARKTPVALAAEVDTLVARGQQMCRAGQIRGGIIRLRRALMLMHLPPPTASR